jgi:hypothetical protein
MSVPKIGSELLSVLKVLSATALVIVATAAGACRAHSPPPAAIDAESEVAGEPDEYSATVVRTIEDGDNRVVEETRVAVAGEMTRQEWIDLGEKRVLILRPDLGKSYLLAPDKKMYVESPIYPEAPGNGGSPGGGASKQKELSEQGPGKGPVDADADQLDGLFATAPEPTQGTDSQLPDQTIEGHLCKVWERRASFPDGHTEVTRTFRASDLSGLAIRIETESIDGGRKVRATTERRDVRTSVSPDEFAIPPGFRRVDALDHK